MQYYKNLVSFWLNHPNSLNNGLQFKASTIVNHTNLLSAKPKVLCQWHVVTTGLLQVVPNLFVTSRRRCCSCTVEGLFLHFKYTNGHVRCHCVVTKAPTAESRIYVVNQG